MKGTFVKIVGRKEKGKGREGKEEKLLGIIFFFIVFSCLMPEPQDFYAIEEF